MKKPTGYVIYQGPSLLDQKPIIVVAIVKSKNVKTDNMVQTYIIRNDIDPRDASRLGEDFSICGNCPHRGIANPNKASGIADKRACYVNIGKGPTIVYKGIVKGLYPSSNGHKAIASLGHGRMVRLGTYGDPSAVPSYIWESLLSLAAGHTGYSHQANVPGADYRPDLVMNSADSLQDAKAAWDRGERTFRIVRDLSEMVAVREIPCPSLNGISCVKCGLCSGTAGREKAKSIVIPVHGPGAVNLAA